jgi:hypothetical protein
MSRTLTILLALLVPTLPALALDIDILPESPDINSPVNIQLWQTMGDTGYQTFQTLYTRSGNTFDVTWYFKSLHGTPGKAWWTIVTDYHSDALVGQLPEGTYTVNATLRMAFYPEYDEIADYQTVARQTTTTFYVVPEPATLLPLAAGLALARRRSARS